MFSLYLCAEVAVLFVRHLRRGPGVFAFSILWRRCYEYNEIDAGVVRTICEEGNFTGVESSCKKRHDMHGRNSMGQEQADHIS